MVTASVDAERLARKLHAEREARRAMRDVAERQRLALRLLGSRLARLHACIMEVPDGGCGDVETADCRKGCSTCWCVWAELEAGRLQERQRQRQERAMERARARERRRPVVPEVPEGMDLDDYMARYGAD